MAGDWLKVRHDLPDDPAVIAMAGELAIDQDAVVGKLLRFWIWADRQTVDGNAAGVTPAFLDAHVRCDGFARALKNVGWLRITKGRISIPDFEKHMSQSAKQRALTANRVKRQRNGADVTESLPEKRREEKSKKKPPIYPPCFDEWWEWYPRKVGKDKALKAYQQATARIQQADGCTADEARVKLLDQVKAFADSDKARGGYCWYPATWLNGGHYDDDPEGWKDQTHGKRTSQLGTGDL